MEHKTVDSILSIKAQASLDVEQDFKKKDKSMSEILNEEENQDETTRGDK